MTTRRGFTMVELMIGLVLTLAVGGVTYSMLLNSTRVTRAQNEKVGVQDNVRSGALIIANELRDLGYDVITASGSAALGNYAAATRTDIIEMFKGTMTYHATRGIGFVCAVSNAAPYKVRVTQSSWQSFRTPKATDSLMVYVENDPQTASDDAWIHLGISGNPASVACPGAGAPAGWEFTVTAPTGGPVALNLNSALSTAAYPAGRLVVGGPVRLTEVVRMSHYQAADGLWYLGMKSESVAGDVLQPVVGPLVDSSTNVHGLAFIYRDINNGATAVAANVRSIEIQLNGVTTEAIAGEKTHGMARDTLSMTTRVTLRNTLR